MPTILEALTCALEHQQAGRFPQAEEIYCQVLAQDPDNIDALHLLGMTAHQLGRHDAAVELIERAIRLNPAIPGFHNNLGRILQAQGRLAEAVCLFERALGLHPDYPEAHINLATAFQAQKRFGEAVTHYREALRLQPECAEAHNNLGNTLAALGRAEEAIACYSEALRLRPAYAEAWVNLSGVLREQNRLEEATACCQRALNFQPDLAEAHSSLAAILIKQDRFAEAEAEARRPLELKPNLKAAQLLDEQEPLDRLPYLLLGMKETRYGHMIFLPHDCYIGRSLIQLGEFSYGEARLIEQCLCPGMTALDVGAHIGALTLPMAKAVGRTGRVLAFEPQIALYLLLCANVALSNASRTTCYRAVVGNRIGKIKMPAIDYSTSSNFGGYGEECFTVEAGQGEKGDDIVDLLTIDQLDLDACHFMKIDVEGMEKTVLEGARETIKRFNPVMLIENDRRLRAKGLIEYIEELGYKAYWHTPRLFNAANFAKNRKNNFSNLMSIDVLCVPRGSNADVVGRTRCTPEDAVHPECCQD